MSQKINCVTKISSSTCKGNMSVIKRKRTTFDNKPILKRFQDKVVLITGGARGIGQAAALRFASEGAYVYILDMIDGTETLNKIKQNDYSSYSKCAYFKLNVTKYNEVKQCIDTIASKHGYIDALVQCAGITGKTGIQSHTVDPLDFERVWKINCLGIFNLCKAVIPVMLKENYGRIVNIASISGKEGNPGQAAYASSKGAVIALTKTMSKDYAKTGITINSLAPAVIKTAMVASLPKSQVNMMTRKIPMGRTGTLEEVAAVITYMASEENSFSTGFCFDMTGGRATY
eukprot:73043_1